jgi:hypothetical protein
MIESLKWGKLEEKIKTNRICMLYEIKNGLIDIDSHQYIQSNDSRIRGKDRLHQERTSNETFSNSFFPRSSGIGTKCHKRKGLRSKLPLLLLPPI